MTARYGNVSFGLQSGLRPCFNDSDPISPTCRELPKGIAEFQRGRCGGFFTMSDQPEPEEESIVFPNRMELRIFANREGGITLEQDDQMGNDAQYITIGRRDVPEVIRFLRKAVRDFKMEGAN